MILFISNVHMDYYLQMRRFGLRIILHVIGIHYPLNIMYHRPISII